MTILNSRLEALISTYNNIVKGIDDQATASNDRAYGGVIRSSKGTLVEDIAAELVKIAWTIVLKQPLHRMKINKQKMPIGVKAGYVDRIAEKDVQHYVKEHLDALIYKFGTDVQVFIDEKLVLPIECKAYTENAMIKRILFDAMLMKEAVKTQTYYLVQLESQLGGDYSELKTVSFGSPATHALMSHVDVELKIITLLQGERKVDRPIHKAEFFKELKIKELLKAVNIFADALLPYAK